MSGFDQKRIDISDLQKHSFKNLLRKEMKAWYGTRSWLVNLVIWPAALGGLVAIMLFVLPTISAAVEDPAVAEAGGPVAFGIDMGNSVFFELGMMAVAIGTIILTQDAIVEEKNNGVAEWVLSNPVPRKAYLFSKLAANIFWIFLLLVLVPSVVVYGMLYLRLGGFYPIVPYLYGVGLIFFHTLFYLVLTISLGAWLDQRSAILGVSLGMVMGGMIVGGIFKPLLYITPWMMGKMANLIVSQVAVPTPLLYSSIAVSAGWMILFVLIGIKKLNATEF